MRRVPVKREGIGCARRARGMSNKYQELVSLHASATRDRNIHIREATEFIHDLAAKFRDHLGCDYQYFRDVSVNEAPGTALPNNTTRIQSDQTFLTHFQIALSGNASMIFEMRTRRKSATDFSITLGQSTIDVHTLSSYEKAINALERHIREQIGRHFGSPMFIV